MNHPASSLPRLVVFGEALTDFVRTDATQWHSVAGGACWNVARAAARLGLATGWGGAVSNDLFGQEIVTLSQASGLDMRFLQQVDRAPLIAMVHQTQPPQYFFLGNDSADLAFDESLLPQGWEDACEYAHFGCISLVRQPLGERLVGIAERLHARGVKVSFDPNCRNLMGADYPALFERLAAISAVIKLSDEDLAQIYPQREVDEALAHVRSLAPDAALMYTRGAEGMTLYLPDAIIEQPAYHVEVADTVGAGDACVGGWLASRMLCPQASWQDHLRFAAATAAANCVRAGAHAPTREEVEALIAATASAA